MLLPGGVTGSTGGFGPPSSGSSPDRVVFFKNKSVWGFKANKEFRKKASEAYKDNWTKYIEVLPHKKISAMFDRHRKKEYMKNLKPIIPEGYDEFKM